MTFLEKKAGPPVWAQNQFVIQNTESQNQIKIQNTEFEHIIQNTESDKNPKHRIFIYPV